jgi:hypothetical protein
LHSLISAALINSGHKPIVDFNYIYPPLLDYLCAIAFRMLGCAAIVPWILSSILYIAVTIQAARFLRQRVPLFGLVGPLMTLLAGCAGGEGSPHSASAIRAAADVMAEERPISRIAR